MSRVSFPGTRSFDSVLGGAPRRKDPMSYRDALPQLDDRPFLTDGGLETDLIFNHGADLPEFASFALLSDDEGTAQLRAYFEPYAKLARDRGVGFVLESPTWRASSNWGRRI